MIIFIARSTMFWSFLYSMTSFLIDLYANVLFMQLATSERLLKTDKCLSHLSFPIGRCSFLNFEISIAPSDDSCARRILKYLILFARKHQINFFNHKCIYNLASPGLEKFGAHPYRVSYVHQTYFRGAQDIVHQD